MIQKRIARRVDIELKVDIFYDGKIYQGAIKNISETGIGYMLTYSINDNEELDSLREAKISFMTPLGDIFHLNCRTVWLSRTLPEGETVIIGMKITEPPPEYRKWIEKILSEREESMADKPVSSSSE
jgi:hypothetical protein